MITARKTSAWRSRYEIFDAGRSIAIWDGSLWKSGGDVDLGGRRYRVRGNAWGTTYAMTDDAGAPVASAGRVGRKRWTVEAGGQAYEFRRASIWRDEQELYVDKVRVGSISRPSMWRSDLTADLPGLPLPVQVFVVGVFIAVGEAQAASA
jgi:hypothetical protein